MIKKHMSLWATNCSCQSQRAEIHDSKAAAERTRYELSGQKRPRLGSLAEKNTLKITQLQSDQSQSAKLLFQIFDVNAMHSMGVFRMHCRLNAVSFRWPIRAIIIPCSPFLFWHWIVDNFNVAARSPRLSTPM